MAPEAALRACVCRPGPEPLWTSLPFSALELAGRTELDGESCVYLEVTCNDQPLFSRVMCFVSKQVKGARSIRVDMGKGGSGCSGMTGDEEFDSFMAFKGKGKGLPPGRRGAHSGVKLPSASLGFGWHAFTYARRDGPAVKVFVLVQRSGEPVGDRATSHISMVLFVEGSEQSPLLELCREATEASAQNKENFVKLWRYDGFWEPSACKPARSLDSVVLAEEAKKPLLEDIEWFLKDDTQAFYAKHGIPYHRCYLFHGPPGAGKTSFIYALAGHLQRNLCFMQMSRKMADDSFRNAMGRLPRQSMVVLEDVDALFTHHREADYNASSLSFSGFLNCLDGLGAPDDVIICMTTNHPERLDPAVMRPGRVDIKVMFKPPSGDVAARYFKTFYPGEDEAADAFSKAVGGRVGEKKVSMAQLQHFFLACNRLRLGAGAAAEHVQDFVFEDGVSARSRARSFHYA